MKESDLLKNVLAGRPVVVVEYRSFKLDQLRFADKRQGGSMVTKPIVKHGIELRDTQASITEWLPDGFEVKQAKPTFKKGDRCVLTIQGIETVQGFASIKGVLEPLEK